MPTLIPLTLPAPLPLEGERPPELAEGIAFLGTLPAHHICGPAWSPDGTLLAYSYPGTGWYAAEVLRPADGMLLSRWVGDGYSPWMEWARDGTRLLFVTDLWRPEAGCGGGRLSSARLTDPSWLVLADCIDPRSFAGTQWMDERTFVVWIHCGTQCSEPQFYDLVTNTWSISWRGLLGGYESSFLLSADRLWVAGDWYALGGPRASIGRMDPWRGSRPLTAGSSENIVPQFWAGHMLAFMVYPPGDDSKWPEPLTAELHLLNADTGETSLLAQGVQGDGSSAILDPYGSRTLMATAFLDPAGTRVVVVMAGLPQVSPDGVLVAEPSTPHIALLSWPERQLLATYPVDPRPNDHPEGNVNPWPLWSPDGSLMVFQQSAGNLVWLDRDGHSGPILARPLEDREITCVGWGAEGRMALLVGKTGSDSDRRLWLVSIPAHPAPPAPDEQPDRRMPATD